MKTLLAILFSIVLISIVSFVSPTKETVVTGTITLNSNDSSYVNLLSIEFRIDSTVIAKTRIQKGGRYVAAIKTDKPVDMYCTGFGFTDTYIQTIRPSAEDTVSVNFKIPRAYKKFLWKAVCPKCSRHDQTINIVHGRAIVFTHMNNKGEKVFVPYNRKHYYDGGCVTSDTDPKYFCKRDQIKF